VKDILGMLKNGEERLLEAVLHGKIPVTIATMISGASDEESQRLLMEAYERKEVTQKTLGSSNGSSTSAAILGRITGRAPAAGCSAPARKAS